MPRLFPLVFALVMSWPVSGHTQQLGAEKVKVPKSAAIQPNPNVQVSTPVGNVIVTYSDSTTDIWTLKGNCADPKVSVKGAVGWQVYELGSDGHSLNQFNGLYVNNRLTVCQAGKVVASLRPQKAFIEAWNFTPDGSQVVVKSRGAHGPAVIELFGFGSGAALAWAHAYAKGLPDWAAPFAD